MLKQPSTVLNDPEDDEEDGETEADHKSGYTHVSKQRVFNKEVR